MRTFAMSVCAVIAVSLPARADCPWSPEDFNDDAKVAAHVACRQAEMFDAFNRADAAYRDMTVRLTELYLLLTAEGDKRLDQRQSAWLAGTEKACPPATKEIDEMTAHANCLEGAYVDRAKFLDQRLAECKSVGCQLDRL